MVERAGKRKVVRRRGRSETIQTAELNPKQIWRKILLVEAEGAPLTDDERRALLIRRTCLSICSAITQIAANPVLGEDVVSQAQVVVQYREGMSLLQELGIKGEMHVGEDQSAYLNPLVEAEWVAGQLVPEDGETMTTARQASLQVQEHSILGARVGDNDAVNLVGINNFTPNSRRWMASLTLVGALRRFLASELDQPQSSP